MDEGESIFVLQKRWKVLPPSWQHKKKKLSAFLVKHWLLSLSSSKVSFFLAAHTASEELEPIEPRVDSAQVPEQMLSPPQKSARAAIETEARRGAKAVFHRPRQF